MAGSDSKKNRCFGQVPAGIEFWCFIEFISFLFFLWVFQSYQYYPLLALEILCWWLDFPVSVVASDSKITNGTRQILILISTISNILWFFLLLWVYNIRFPDSLHLHYSSLLYAIDRNKAIMTSRGKRHSCLHFLLQSMHLLNPDIWVSLSLSLFLKKKKKILFLFLVLILFSVSYLQQMYVDEKLKVTLQFKMLEFLHRICLQMWFHWK